MSRTTTVALIAAATLEVVGDYLIRIGLKDAGWSALVGGAVLLASYGFAVNWYWQGNFSTLLGLYVVAFFLVSQAWAAIVDGDTITPLRWLGVALIVTGGVAVHYSAPGGK